jgi:hypothetical protein
LSRIRKGDPETFNNTASTSPVSSQTPNLWPSSVAFFLSSLVSYGNPTIKKVLVLILYLFNILKALITFSTVHERLHTFFKILSVPDSTPILA